MKKCAEDMNRHFSKEDTKWLTDIWKDTQHHSSSGKIPIKTTMSYHLTPVRMASINNSGNNRCWRVCGERGSLLRCWWESKLVQPLWKTVWRFLENLKIELPYNPGIVLLGIYTKDAKIQMQRGTCTPRLVATLSSIAKQTHTHTHTHTHTRQNIT